MLVVVAVLFAVLVAVGATREPASPDPQDHGWVERFQFGQPPAVKAGQVDSGCFEQATRRLAIPGLGACQLVIAPAGERTRLLTLEPVSPEFPALEVDLAPNDRDAVEIDDWEPEAADFPLEIPVGQAGATATIACRAQAGCELRLAG